MDKVNPWEILNYRRKIKRLEETGVVESMKLLKRVREMQLSTKMLACTEFPRTLVWISHRIKKDSETNEQKIKLLQMCKYLTKEWKDLFEKERKEKESKNGHHADE